MLIAFLDDCHLRADGWFGFGGLIIEDVNAMKLESEFVALLKVVGVPIDDAAVDTEVKWSPRKGNWIRENLGDKRFELYEKLLQLIQTNNAKLMGAVFHYSALSDKQIFDTKWDEEKARQQGFVHCFEKIQVYAEKNCQPSLVVCDNEDDEKTTRARVRETFELVRAGSPYISFEKIYRHAWAVESHYHTGIQLADLVMGVTTNLLAGHADYAGQLWPKIRGSFIWHKRMKNVPQKWGLSILPSSEIDIFIKAYNPYGF